MWTHLGHLQRWAGCDLDRVLNLFPDPSALVIGRRDKVAAAVSWVRALATDTWSRTGADPNPIPHQADLVAISTAHEEQHRAEEGWAALLARGPIPCSWLAYEDLVVDPSGALAQAAAIAGVAVAPALTPTDLAIQRDGWSAEVTSRWTETTGGCDRCGALADVTAAPRAGD